MEFLSIIIGFIFVLSGIFIVHSINNNAAAKKLKLFSLAGYAPFKIYNKPCFVKIIHLVPPRPRNPLSFDKCNLFITDDFVIIQGIDGLIIKTIVTQFVLSKGNRPIKGTENYGRLNWLEAVELNPNKTQIKLVYRVDYTWKPTYSVIISDLSPGEFDTLRIFKDWI